MYDTIIIGSDLSSLIAAVILARNGKKTVLLSENDHPSIFSESQYTFNCDPFPLTGFGLTQTISRLFEDINMPLTELPDIQIVNPGLQIILPNHRVECFFESDAFLKDLEREFPSYGDDIQKFYASVLKISDLFYQWISKMPAVYPRTRKDFLWILKMLPIFTRERFTILRKYRLFTKNPELCRFIEAQIAVLSNTHEETGTLSLSSAYILSLPMRGIYCNKGSNEIFLNFIRSYFEDCGGLIINKCSVIKFHADKEVDVDIKANNILSTIKGRNLIASTKSESFKVILQSNRKLARMNRKLKSLKKSYYPFTLHMGVHEKCIPEKMGHYVVVVGDKNRNVIDNNCIFLEISDSDNTERAPFGKRAVSAMVFLQKPSYAMNNGELKGVSDGIFKSLDEFLPFLKESLDYLNIDKSIEMSRRCQAVIQQKYIMRSCPFLGISKLSHKTPMKNVFMTGGMLISGLGFEGEILSGMNAANAVLEREGK